MQEQIRKKDTQERNKTIRKLQARYTCVLTIPEGEILKQIIADHGCQNLSQLCKKIVRGEISLH